MKDVSPANDGARKEPTRGTGRLCAETSALWCHGDRCAFYEHWASSMKRVPVFVCCVFASAQELNLLSSRLNVLTRGLRGLFLALNPEAARQRRIPKRTTRQHVQGNFNVPTGQYSNEYINYVNSVFGDLFLCQILNSRVNQARHVVEPSVIG